MTLMTQESPRTPIPEPPRVAGLVNERLLGIGGRCAVWQVRRQDSGTSGCLWVSGGDIVPEVLALKVPLASPRSAPAAHSLRAELDAMLPLAHPHLVRAWGIALDTGRGGRGLLLDSAAAGSLASMIARTGRLTPSQLVTALSPVADACAHLHAQGAAHGDISAANILLTPEGRPVLADLGDAHLLGMGEQDHDAEQDVRALARVAWRALTGEEPGEGRRRTPLQVICPDVMDGLADLLEQCLELPDSEVPQAGEFAAELYACAAPEPLDLCAQADDAVLAEVPTVLPGHLRATDAERRRRGTLVGAVSALRRLLMRARLRA
ncbi:protein kinase [Nesterenkonia populi]|uniref:protein kinase n=1 Tax=Nesterenkonia populi TaxID=1591087 RepID=UPI0011BDB0D3|nr:protein kinase [Nesterenkonia populi]